MASLPALVIAVALYSAEPADAESVAIPPWFAAAGECAQRVDEELGRHWQLQAMTPASAADDGAWGRRVWLDLAGRVPAAAELDRFVNDPRPDRRMRLALELLEGAEFSLHFGRVVQGWLDQRGTTDDPFLAWLRASLDDRRAWSDIFRAVLTGPWHDESQKPAARFLSKRIKNLDNLTSDTARAFFGVDITCARCHDHPLVDDWKQDHYYGLAAFFNRATEQGKNGGTIVDKPEGEVTFARRNGQQQTAAMMFLSGRTFATAPQQNRREQLVAAALEDGVFLSRAAVNRMWAWFLGRGLVHPVDQLHSGNPAAIPALLDLLADDFMESNYDLRRLAAAIVLSRAYQSSSRVERAAPPVEAFAAFPLKPLTPWQLADSWLFVTGEPSEAGLNRAARRDAFLLLEKQAAELTALLDPAGDEYQASAGEALFVAHHANLQKLLEPHGNNLAARLAAVKNGDQRIEQAWRAILGRTPSDGERIIARDWRHEQGDDDRAAVASLIWALIASAEFRFNH